jgi:hypothetical protein
VTLDSERCSRPCRAPPSPREPAADPDAAPPRKPWGTTGGAWSVLDGRSRGARREEQHRRASTAPRVIRKARRSCRTPTRRAEQGEIRRIGAPCARRSSGDATASCSTAGPSSFAPSPSLRRAHRRICSATTARWRRLSTDRARSRGGRRGRRKAAGGRR